MFRLLSVKLKIFLLIILLIFLGLIQSYNQLREASNTAPTQKSIPTKESKFTIEIENIKAAKNLNEQIAFYKELIERVGPEQAQEQLYISGLSFDGQTHLLNHTVGDWLYEKYGIEGLTLCKDYFLSSCYHGFVINAIADRGFDGLSEIMNTCWQKGTPNATQCAHAIGHGFLANVGYANLTKALTSCDKLASLSKNFPLYNCHDGVFMENIWAVHEDGKPSKDRWLKDTDPVYPCNEQQIPQKYMKACWSNQPMRMYQLFGGDVGRVAAYCLSVNNDDHKKTCFDGLARQIHPVAKGDTNEIFRLCNHLPKEWVDACVFSIVKSEFGVGGRTLPYQLCEQMRDGAKPSCYKALSEIIKSYYREGLSERELLCTRIPDTNLQQGCMSF